MKSHDEVENCKKIIKIINLGILSLVMIIIKMLKIFIRYESENDFAK